MKKILSFLLALLMVTYVSIINVEAKNSDIRGAWLSSVYNMDWPSAASKGNVAAQKAELAEKLDKLNSIGINAVFLQVRPKSDALYKSSINPWSDVLTGTQGKDPGYDPLQYAIDEAHKRGMELHAWFNPYRVTTSGTNLNALASNNQARLNPSWVIAYNNALYYDPGNPEVRKYLLNTVMEVVKNYNVDGIHFDDYFYPAKDFNDGATFSKYGNGVNLDDWRRNNVNELVKTVNSNINSAKPYVDFGISPAGIWKNKSSDPAGSDTNGKESYYASYADSVAWIKNGWIDYITPQLYWTIGQANADYSILAKWWSDQVKGTNVKLYIGQGVYKPEVASQITSQLSINSMYEEIKGSIYFSTRDILGNAKLQADLKKIYVDSLQKIKLIGSNRYDTAAKISNSGWVNDSDTVVIVNGYANADGITATPLASAYNAPILLTEKNTLGTTTINEIKRLSAKKVILVGGEGVIAGKVVNEIMNINSSMEVKRIGGKDRYETSLLLAKELDTLVDVSKAYICYGLGEADALSVSSKAGAEIAPILLSNKENISTDAYEWLKAEELDTAYFIGGSSIIKDSLISQVNGITASNVSGNRIGGNNRYETNAEVLKRLYSQSELESILATKGDVLADALTAGPLAAKLNSPVVLLSSTLNPSQKNILVTKTSKAIYEIGGGINQNAIQELIKTIQ